MGSERPTQGCEEGDEAPGDGTFIVGWGVWDPAFLRAPCGHFGPSEHAIVFLNLRNSKKMFKLWRN